MRVGTSGMYCSSSTSRMSGMWCGEERGRVFACLWGSTSHDQAAVLSTAHGLALVYMRQVDHVFRGG